MRKLAFVLVALVVVLVAVGAIYFRKGEGEVSITVDTEKIEGITTDAIEKGKELGEKAAQQAREALEQADDATRPKPN